VSGEPKQEILHGLPISPGIAMGTVVVYQEHQLTNMPLYSVNPADIEHEIARLKHASRQAEEELLEVADRVRDDVGPEEAAIFNSHVMMLRDPTFITGVEEKIIENHVNVEAALSEVIEKYSRIFQSVEDAYFKERAADIRDVGKRVLQKLLFVSGAKPVAHEHVLVLKDLYPTLAAQLDRAKVLGIVSETGAFTSHAAIIARSRDIPAVGGVKGILQYVNDGDEVIVDGTGGLVYLHPTQEVKEHYQETKRELEEFWRKSAVETAGPVCTTDGVAIHLGANIRQTLDEDRQIPQVLAGVGLYRTEFLFLSSHSFPSEEAQFEAYRSVVLRMADKGVNVRVLDIGGDKFLPYYNHPTEPNPYLGWRGMKVLLEETDIFKTQLRAILRASAFGKTRIMFPMITSLDELFRAKEVLETAKEELRTEGRGFDQNIEHGVMIEVPSAAVIADTLIKHCDFLSVGSNDLIQYSLVVDRSSEKVAGYYEPMHPAVLRMLRDIVGAAKAVGKVAAICGEISGDPFFTRLLLGIGYRHLSMNLVSLPHIVRVIQESSIDECEKLAAKALQAETIGETRVILEEAVPFPSSGYRPA